MRIGRGVKLVDFLLKNHIILIMKIMSQLPHKIAFVVWREEGGWVSQSLDVEVASQGNTREEAIENLHDALSLYFDEEKMDEIMIKKEPMFGELTLQHA